MRHGTKTSAEYTFDLLSHYFKKIPSSTTLSLFALKRLETVSGNKLIKFMLLDLDLKVQYITSVQVFYLFKLWSQKNLLLYPGVTS